MARWHARLHLRRKSGSALWRSATVAGIAVLVIAAIGAGVYLLTRGSGSSAVSWARLQGGATLPATENYWAAYDPKIDKVVKSIDARASGYPSTTWVLDLTTDFWTQMPASTDVPRSREVALVYDDTSRRIIRVGYNENTHEYDTWAYDSSANTWTNLHPAATPAVPIFGVALAYDPQSGRVIMVESHKSQFHTWAYDSRTNTWSEIKTDISPPVRWQAAFAYDYSTNRLLLFGGFGHLEKPEGGVLDDTWAFDSATNKWSELKPSKSPPARDEASMVYDKAAARMILFGGSTKGKVFNDTWAYDSKTNAWTRVDTSGSPKPLFSMTTVYDPVMQGVLVIGGKDKDMKSNTDSWVLAGDTSLGF